MKGFASQRVISRGILLSGVAALGLTLPSVSHAQDAQEGAEAAPESGNTIIVTASKREQTLQDTPIAVSVASAETIEQAQIRDIADLSTIVPSLRTTQSSGQFATTFLIRGFGTSGQNIGLEPSVAVFVDGVYRSRALSQIGDFPDVERVEVLRGPQSTLFGKNASAGVISIVTKEPQFDLGGSLEVSYGNLDAVVAKGYVTGPVSESIAVSAAAGYNRRDGFITNRFNGDELNDRDRYFLRGQALFDNGGPLKFRLIADYDEIDENCCAAFNIQPSLFTNIIQLAGGQVNDAAGVPDADEVFLDVTPTSNIRNWGVSGQLDYEFGALNLTSITAYRDTSLNADGDADFSSGALITGSNIGQVDLETFTQELRLTSDFDGPFNFLLGAYYINETANVADQILYGDDARLIIDVLVQGLTRGAFSADTLEGLLGGAPNSFWQPGQGLFNQFSQDNEAFSLFGTVDVDLTDRLTLTLGANYTHDAKDLTSNSVSTDLFSAVDLVAVGNALLFQATGSQAFADANDENPDFNPLLGFQALQFLPPFQNIPNAVEDGRIRNDDLSWAVRLSYDLTDTVNIYGTWATGFKASSANLSRDSRPTATDFAALVNQGLAVTNLDAGSRFADPEESEVFELGIKGQWDQVGANLTFFKQSIDDFQTNVFTGLGFIFANADSQSTFGIEFDGYVQPTDGLTFSVAMTYLDAQFDDFVNSPFGDISGEQIVEIPELTATFTGQYEKELANGDRIMLRGEYSYQSRAPFEFGLPAFIGENPDGSLDFAPALAASRAIQDDVNTVNASLTYALESGLELTVWGRNVLNERNITGIFDTPAQDGSISAFTNVPRTYGVSARYRF